MVLYKYFGVTCLRVPTIEGGQVDSICIYKQKRVKYTYCKYLQSHIASVYMYVKCMWSPAMASLKSSQVTAEPSCLSKYNFKPLQNHIDSLKSTVKINYVAFLLFEALGAEPRAIKAYHLGSLRVYCTSVWGQYVHTYILTYQSNAYSVCMCRLSYRSCPWKCRTPV